MAFTKRGKKSVNKRGSKRGSKRGDKRRTARKRGVPLYHPT